MRLNIRLAGPGDLDSILAIARECPEAPHWTAASYAPFLDPDPKPPLLRTLHVAEAEGQIRGFAAATLVLDGQENRCELDSVTVVPGARRQGIGAALLQSVLAWAVRYGAHSFSLEVRASNGSALRLYERLGMIQQGRRHRYYADPEEDALILAMRVTPVQN